jgi:hypothetical protein
MRYRLRQEALLGLGGLALLRALGYWDIDTSISTRATAAY